MELTLEKLLTSGRTCAQSNSQELVCSSSFHVLLVKEVKQQVFVALDEALRINLSVLKLFIPISLDAFEQGTQRLLLLLSQKSFLLLYVKL